MLSSPETSYEKRALRKVPDCLRPYTTLRLEGSSLKVDFNLPKNVIDLPAFADIVKKARAIVRNIVERPQREYKYLKSIIGPELKGVSSWVRMIVSDPEIAPRVEAIVWRLVSGGIANEEVSFKDRCGKTFSARQVKRLIDLVETIRRCYTTERHRKELLKTPLMDIEAEVRRRARVLLRSLLAKTRTDIIQIPIWIQKKPRRRNEKVKQRKTLEENVEEVEIEAEGYVPHAIEETARAIDHRLRREGKRIKRRSKKYQTKTIYSRGNGRRVHRLKLKDDTIRNR